MQKSSTTILLSGVLIGSLLLSAWQAVPVYAQVISFPAEINKDFSPITILLGGVSRLSVTIYNPNIFQLTDATWTDNLISVQPGLALANPVNVSNTCGGTVTASVGATSFSLHGGVMPAQVGATPGFCTVAVDVTSTTPGNLINRIPAGALSANGDGGTLSNTTPASATLHVGLVQAPSLSKSFSPTTMLVGQTARLTISLRNTDVLTDLTQASVTDHLPSNVVLANPVSPTLGGCGTSAALTAASGSTTITVNNAVIAANTACVIRVNVTSTAAGVYTNTIPANALTDKQGVTNAAAASATLNVQALNLHKAFSPASFQAGGTTTLTITLENPSNTSYTGVAIADTLPGNVLTVVPGSAVTTCGGTVTTTLPRTVSLTGGTLPAGSATTPGTCTITVQVTAAANGTTGTFTNQIPAGALTTDQGVSNILPVTATVRVFQVRTNVGGNKTFTPATILAGENSRLRINLTAPTDTSLTNFSITDHLPPNVTVSNSSPATLSPSCGSSATLTAVTGATSITLANGNIATGVTCQINVYVTSSVNGVHTNTIQPTDITNNENRSVPNPLTADLTVQVLADYSISKAFTPPTIRPGGISTLTITLHNHNALPLINASLTDLLPGTPTDGLIVAPTPNASTTCANGVVTAIAGSQTISLTGGSVPAQSQNVEGTCTIALDVQGLGAITRRTNTIPPANASATIQGTNTVINPSQGARADLVITNLAIGVVKGFNPLTVFGGSASTLSVELINANNVLLTGVALTDHLPNGMFIATPANLAVGNCGGTLSGSPGANTFSLSGASLAAAAHCVFTLSVTMNVNGNLTNTIPANAVITNEGASNPDPAQASLTNLPGASVSKSFSPNPITAGDHAVLNLTIQNTGTAAFTGMGLIDTLPTGLAITDSPTSSNQCGGTLTANVGTRTITLAGGSLAANSSCTMTISVQGGSPGSYANTILPGSLTNDQGATNHQAATDTLVITTTSGGGGSSNGSGNSNGNGNGTGTGNPTPTPSANGFLIPVTGFAPHMVTHLDASTRQKYDFTTLTLEIPDLQVKAPIVGVPLNAGRWDIAWLQDQVGWLNGTAYPASKGNSVLTGHVTNADGKPGIFFRLKELGAGAAIRLETGGYRYTFQVVSNQVVQVDDVAVLQHEDTAYLTLITCDGYDPATGTYVRRVAVRAKLVQVDLMP